MWIMSYFRTISAGLAIASAVMLAGCGSADVAGSGPTTTEQRPVDGVHAVELRTSGDLTITVGPTPQLTITAGRTTLRSLTSMLRGGTVVLGTVSGRVTTGDIHYELTLPTLDGLVVAGSGTARGSVAAVGATTVTVSGSGSADLDGIAASALTVELSGSGDIELAGTTGTQDVALAGSGSYHGTGLISKTSNVQIDGSGDAQITATEVLDAQVRGSGDISYSGTPALSMQVSGNGTVSAGTR
jgi:hypothetical protein